MGVDAAEWLILLVGSSREKKELGALELAGKFLEYVSAEASICDMDF